MTVDELVSRNSKIESCIARIANGDRVALGELYDEVKTDVYAFSLSKTQNVEDAEDATEETFVRVYRYAKLYVPKRKPLAWVFTIAINVIKRQKTLKSRHLAYDDGIGEEEDTADSVEQTLVKSSFISAMMRLVDETTRNIIVMHAVSGLKHREIAKIIDVPLATVLSKYNRGIKKLKEYAKREGEGI